MSSRTTLESAAQDRKARLAQLKSLKRKQPSDSTPSDSQPPSKLQKSPSPEQKEPDITTTYLSGRNYDPETRGPKLGFEVQPSSNQSTLESQAESIAQQTRQQAEEEEKNEAPLDLFKLRPKKPNWDLKRDLERRMQVLNVRTENAIARLVRERIEEGKRKALEKGGPSVDGDGEAVGMEGVDLVEAVHVREREEEEDERREREADALDNEYMDAS